MNRNVIVFGQFILLIAGIGGAVLFVGGDNERAPARVTNEEFLGAVGVELGQNEILEEGKHEDNSASKESAQEKGSGKDSPGKQKSAEKEGKQAGISVSKESKKQMVSQERIAQEQALAKRGSEEKHVAETETSQKNSIPSPKAKEEKSSMPESWSPQNENSPAPPPAPTQQGSDQTEEQASYLKILISEIQIEGASSKDEFVELFNPNTQDVDLKGWSLKRKTSGGNETNLVSKTAFSGTIAALGYFLVAPPSNEDGTPNYTGSATPDLFYSGKTYSVASDNTALLYNPNGDLVDKIGFGETQDFEGVPIANHSQGESLGRKFENGTYQDTDNNSEDLEAQIPSPKAQNQKKQTPPPPQENGDKKEGSSPTVKLVINEIAWMGTKASQNDEWIELYNGGPESVSLAGWKLTANDGTPSIELSGEISGQGYYLLERPDDTPISDVQADLTYTGALNNEGELLKLFDAQGNLIDFVDALPGWFAGKNDEKTSMERKNPEISGSDPANWASNNQIKRNGKAANDSPINGTPRGVNSASLP